MQSETARLRSFQPRSTKSKRALPWPHPPTWRANPRTLADAGFYFQPSADAVDRVVCFSCGKELAGWAETEDPFREHLEHAPKCCWANCRCSIEIDKEDGQFRFASTSRLPMNRVLEKARKDTFADWPHDKVDGHGANSRNMAKAGFVFTPIKVDDTVTCFYCQTTLDGWEPEDEPYTEHKRRNPACPIFTATVSKPTAPSKAAAATAPSSDRSTGKTTAATAGRLSKTSSKKAAVMEVEVVLPAPAVALKKSTRSKSKVEEVDVEDVEDVSPEPVAPPKKAPKRTKASTAKAAVVLEEETPIDVDAPSPRPAPLRKTKGKSTSSGKKASKASTSIPQSGTEAEEDVDPSPPVPKAKSTSKKTSKALKASTSLDQSEMDVEDVEPPKKTRTRKGSKASTSAGQIAAPEFSDHAPESSTGKATKTKSNSSAKPKTKAKAKGKGKSTAAAESIIEEDKIVVDEAMSGASESELEVEESVAGDVGDAMDVEVEEKPKPSRKASSKSKAEGVKKKGASSSSSAETGKKAKPASAKEKPVSNSSLTTSVKDIEMQKPSSVPAPKTTAKQKKTKAVPPPPVMEEEEDGMDSEQEVETDLGDAMDTDDDEPDSQDDEVIVEEDGEVDVAATPRPRGMAKSSSDRSPPETIKKGGMTNGKALKPRSFSPPPPNPPQPANEVTMATNDQPPPASSDNTVLQQDIILPSVSSDFVLSVEERAMTLEEWIRHEIARQYDELKVDCTQRLDDFKTRAAEVRASIEAL